MPEIDQVFRKNKDFVFRQIDDETILVPIKDNLGDMGSIYNLNEVGAFIWEHFDGLKTIRDIKNRIIDEFEISEQEAQQDLFEFVNQLKEIEAIHAISVKYRKLGKRLHLHDLAPDCSKLLLKAGDLVEGQYFGKVSAGH